MANSKKCDRIYIPENTENLKRSKRDRTQSYEGWMNEWMKTRRKKKTKQKKPLKTTSRTCAGFYFESPAPDVRAAASVGLSQRSPAHTLTGGQRRRWSSPGSATGRGVETHQDHGRNPPLFTLSLTLTSLRIKTHRVGFV